MFEVVASFLCYNINVEHIFLIGEHLLYSILALNIPFRWENTFPHDQQEFDWGNT